MVILMVNNLDATVPNWKKWSQPTSLIRLNEPSVQQHEDHSRKCYHF